MEQKKTVTAIVLTLNEEEFLQGCLKSLRWVDELLVVDAGSRDKTLEIAKANKATIIKSPWNGFPEQRNIGAEHAKSDWLLYVDADERVSRELRREIQKLLNVRDTPFNSYKITHRNYILGKWLKYGGWYPEYQHRLIRKSSLVKWVGELHEHPEVKGSEGYLKGDLIHLTHRGMHWMLVKTIRYTKLEARLRLESGHPKIKVINLLAAPAREVWRRCIQKQGFRDGIIGWIEILYQAFNQFLIMAWLWELQRQKNMSETYSELDQRIIDEL